MSARPLCHVLPMYASLEFYLNYPSDNILAKSPALDNIIWEGWLRQIRNYVNRELVIQLVLQVSASWTPSVKNLSSPTSAGNIFGPISLIPHATIHLAINLVLDDV